MPPPAHDGHAPTTVLDEIEALLDSIDDLLSPYETADTGADESPRCYP